MAVQLGRDRTDGLVYEDVDVGVGKPGTAAAHRPTDRPPARRQDAGAARERSEERRVGKECRYRGYSNPDMRSSSRGKRRVCSPDESVGAPPVALPIRTGGGAAG